MSGTRSPYKGRNSFKTKLNSVRQSGKGKKHYSGFPVEGRSSLVSLFDINQKTMDEIWDKIQRNADD